MKSNEIAILSVSKTITQRISNVLIEKKIDIPVYEYHYFDVVEKAQQLIQGGTRILISRGGTAELGGVHVEFTCPGGGNSPRPAWHLP